MYIHFLTGRPAGPFNFWSMSVIQVVASCNEFKPNKPPTTIVQLWFLTREVSTFPFPSAIWLFNSANLKVCIAIHGTWGLSFHGPHGSNMLPFWWSEHLAPTFSPWLISFPPLFPCAPTYWNSKCSLVPGAVGVLLGFPTVHYEQLHPRKDAPHLLSVLVLLLHFVPDSLQLSLHCHPFHAVVMWIFSFWRAYPESCLSSRWEATQERKSNYEQLEQHTHTQHKTVDFASRTLGADWRCR